MEKRSEVVMDEAGDMKRLKLTSENQEDEALISALRGMSLDVDYWGNILKNECAVTEYEKLKFSDYSEFQKLEKFVRYNWEVHALKSVLGISDSYEEMYFKQKDAAQKQAEHCKQILCALVCERDEGKTRDDPVVTEHEQKLKQTLQIPDDVWVKTCRNLSLAGLIDNFGGQLGEMKLGTSRRELSPSDLLEQASDGLALKGILVINDAKECANLRETVIESPNGVSMKCSGFPQIDGGLEYTSQAQTDEFYRSLQALGHGITTSEYGFADKHTVGNTEEPMDTDRCEQNIYLAKVKYSYIPTAACELEKNEMKLCEGVVKDLKALEQHLEDAGPDSPIQEMSGDFLRKYGSHVNTSVVFGGVYTWQAAYCDKVSCDSENIQNVINDALGGLESMSYSGVGIPRDGTMCGTQVTTDADIAASHDVVPLSKISMNVRKIGGPQGVTSQPLWKLGLLKCSESWAIIDRGRSFQTDFVGIWDLIRNIPNEFSDVEKLAKTLQHSWYVMTGLPTDEKQEEVPVTLDKLLKISVPVWNADTELSRSAVGYLQQLLDQVEKNCIDSDGHEVLLKKLNTDRGLYRFLKQIMRIKEEYSQTDLASICYHLNRMFKLTRGHNFPLRNEISRFVRSEDEEYVPELMKKQSIKSISSLVDAVKQTLLPAMEAGHAESASADKDDGSIVDPDNIDIQATRDIEIAVEHLQIQLEKQKKRYELFLLRIALFEMAYVSDLKSFRIIFTEQSLLGFVQKLEVLFDEYLVYKRPGRTEMQAYLIQLLIQALPENSKSREDDFQMFLSGIQKSLTSDIVGTLTKFTSSTPYYWTGLTDTLDELKRGNKSVLKNKAVLISAFDEIAKSVASGNKFLEVETSPLPDDRTPAGKLLGQLGLMEYYPCKISLQDVMSVGDKCGNGDSSTSLPWRILQKLIMLDYNARDTETRKTTYEDEELVKETPDGKEDEEFTFDSFLGDFDSEGGEEMSLNPLDVFLTIYSCCDMMLKQTLVQKMVQCRLAVPFISPSLCGGPLLYSLWALRSIIVEWKNKDQVCMETSAVCQPVKTVSFIRIGRPSCSKSILLNNVLSDQAHHTFWNRECPLGNSDCTLSDGLVEAQWYLPAGKSADKFEDVTMFLNLRGDGCSHKKQVEFLQKISNVVVCCLETSELGNPQILEAMKEIHSNSSKVILLLVQKDPHLMDQKVLKKLSQQYIMHIGKVNMSNTKNISGIKGSKARTTEDLKQELRNVIQKCLSGQSGNSIEESSALAKVASIEIDEDDQICLKGKELAQEVILCMGHKSTNDCKREMLLLQGENWQEWSRLLKDKQHSMIKGAKVDTIHEKAQIQASMTQIRQKQLKVCNNLSDLMKTFLANMLDVIDTPAVLPYLQWLKIYLDEKSRNTLPGLHREYHKKWLEFSASQCESDNASKLKSELQAAEKVVAEASLGVEHLLREVTQMYEAAMESKVELAPATREIVNQLPTVAAKMLLKGQPIEIMDGDAANVPLTWVKAVFSSLTELVGDKKLFVLSVLGIQSSGKSTLLNTMFGLQFAVSAGRCTRGVYMQLVKVDKERSDLPYDYVLVVDTEGLRAPELGQLKHDNDNQLATFVIGLGDVTLMNIKGENVAEVADVLQIAVHAFLRMKIVNKNFQLHRACVFIHQNVPAVNAKEKMQHGCQKLKERLDEMTREASAIENIVDIRTFNEVIEFDGETNVWYFSDLWHGDPPMAPANPGYSEKVQEVKNSLLNEPSQEQETFLNFSDMKHRVEDLWNGVLSENFVFSFRNSLAAKAYNNLESTYHERSWDVENSINEWITEEATVQLERCSTEEELDNCCMKLLTRLHRYGNELREKARSELENFFDTHNHKDILVEWKTTKTENLNSDTKLFIDRAEKEICQKKDYLRVDLVQKSRLAELNIEIMKKAKNLADEMKGQQAGERELEERFEKFWVERENEYASGTPAVSVPIERTVELLLYKRLEKEFAALDQELKINPLTKPLELDSLEGSIMGSHIEKSHISVQRTMAGRFWDHITFRPQQWHQYKQTAADVCNSILGNVDTHLNDISQQDSGFQELHAKNVIRRVLDGVDKHNQKTQETCFNLLPNIMVKIAVLACRHAVAVFKNMQREYEENHGIERKLQVFKTAAWSLFKNTVNQCTIEVIAADLLIDHIEVLVKQALKSRMSGEIVNQIVRYFSQTKFHLIVKILAELADGSFLGYAGFLKDPKNFSLHWITEFTKKMIFIPSANGNSKYGSYAEQHVVKLVESIRKSIRAATDCLAKKKSKASGIKEWAKAFRDTLQQLPIKEKDLKPMLEQNVEDFENLEELLNDRLKGLEKRVVTSFKEKNPESIKWESTTPYKQILDRLWGCEAQCPFCGEVCQRTDPNHFSPNDCHQCIQHRPSGVRGTRWDSLDENLHGRLVLESCNYKVQSQYLFRRNGQWIPYREYKNYEPDWDIAPSPNMESSKYWMWVMATYKHQLAHWYNTLVPDIPQSWHDITKQEALDSLRQYYN